MSNTHSNDPWPKPAAPKPAASKPATNSDTNPFYDDPWLRPAAQKPSMNINANPFYPSPNIGSQPYQSYGHQPEKNVKNTAQQDLPLHATYKVIDLGTISPEKFQSIIDSIAKSWGKEVASHLDKPASFKDQFKSDFTNAAYRVGAKQLLSLTKNFFIQYARKSCSEESKVRAITELLDTEIGTALMAMFIGFAASQIPQIDSSPKMARILKEFRVEGMTTLGNSAVEALVSSMLPIISSALQTIEKEEVVQIKETSSLSLEDDLIIEEEASAVAPMVRQS